MSNKLQNTMNRKQMQLGDNTGDYDKIKKIRERHCEIMKQEFLVKDHKRVLTLKEKQFVFEDAKIADGFDKDYFRQDINNCLVIKDVIFKKDQPYQKLLAYHIEHLLSHANNGPTNLINSCLLVAGHNIVKGPRELYKFSKQSTKKCMEKYGVTPSNFKKELKDHGIDYISEKYNLLFRYNEKNQIQPTVASLSKTGKNIYEEFSIELLPIIEDPATEVTLETVIKVVLIIAGIVVTIVISKFLWKWSCDGYKKLKHFIKEKKSEKIQLIEKIREVCHDIGLVIYGFLINKNHLVHENNLRREQNKK
jgi:predicted outer membrane protein